jgi:predicted nucleic acid-binding Zn ribbon protein
VDRRLHICGQWCQSSNSGVKTSERLCVEQCELITNYSALGSWLNHVWPGAKTSERLCVEQCALITNYSALGSWLNHVWPGVKTSERLCVEQCELITNYSALGSWLNHVWPDERETVYAPLNAECFALQLLQSSSARLLIKHAAAVWRGQSIT